MLNRCELNVRASLVIRRQVYDEVMRMAREKKCMLI